jgi:hypothetical protein
MTMSRVEAAAVAAKLFDRATHYLSADPSRKGEPARCFLMRVKKGSLESGRFTSVVLGVGETWEEALEDACLFASEQLSEDVDGRIAKVKAELGVSP